MAQRITSAEIAGREAQHKIFNKLCIAYRRSRQNPAFRIRAEDVRNELAIPENVFGEAVDSFVDQTVRESLRYLNRPAKDI
jgi:hypothetical protein